EGLRCLSRARLGDGNGREEMGGVSAELVLVRPEARAARTAFRPGLAARGGRGAANGRGRGTVRSVVEVGLVARAVRARAHREGSRVRHGDAADRPDI